MRECRLCTERYRWPVVSYILIALHLLDFSLLAVNIRNHSCNVIWGQWWPTEADAGQTAGTIPDFGGEGNSCVVVLAELVLVSRSDGSVSEGHYVKLLVVSWVHESWFWWMMRPPKRNHYKLGLTLPWPTVSLSSFISGLPYAKEAAGRRRVVGFAFPRVAF